LCFFVDRTNPLSDNEVDKDQITVEGDKSDDEDFDIAVTLRIGEYSFVYAHNCIFVASMAMWS